MPPRTFPTCRQERLFSTSTESARPEGEDNRRMLARGNLEIDQPLAIFPAAEREFYVSSAMLGLIAPLNALPPPRRAVRVVLIDSDAVRQSAERRLDHIFFGWIVIPFRRAARPDDERVRDPSAAVPTARSTRLTSCNIIRPAIESMRAYSASLTPKLGW